MASSKHIDSLKPEDLFPLFEAMRRSLRQYFSSHKIIHPPLDSENLSNSSGVFVTFRDSSGSVRGSMGFLDTDRALSLAAIDCAIRAAVDDPRYEPIIINDVDRVSIELTLIRSVSELGQDLKDQRKSFKKGVHGFYVEGEMSSAVILPREIAEKDLGFDDAIAKAKLKGGMPANAENLKVHMFDARVFLQKIFSSEVLDITGRPALGGEGASGAALEEPG